MFESTLPWGAPELMRASAFRRSLEEAAHAIDEGPASTRLSQLSPSLMQDLLRFEQNGRQSELLEVMAAAVRHGHDIVVHLQLIEHVVPLTIFPVHRLVHLPVPMEQFLELQLTDLQVLRVERAMLAPPELLTLAETSTQTQYSPLGRLLWELSLRGSRDELLPEIGGQAAYRITPGVDLSGLQLTGSLKEAAERLKRQTTSLREISEWPGFDRPRAMRMLNGLYLQAGLMVSRTHPAATNEGWFSGSR
jgi:hypothetical protein